MTTDSDVTLAMKLAQAVNERNNFVQTHGGFESFASCGQHLGERRREYYDKLEAAVTAARKELDENVPEKKALVKELQNKGETEAANMMAKMFGVRRGFLFWISKKIPR